MAVLKKVGAKLRGYKTIVFNAVIGGAASLGLLLEEFKEIDLTPWFGEYAAKVLVGIAIAGIVLRLTTTGPVAGSRRARRRAEPAGYELLDDEEDDAPRRDTPRSRKARRQG